MSFYSKLLAAFRPYKKPVAVREAYLDNEFVKAMMDVAHNKTVDEQAARDMVPPAIILRKDW